MNAIVEPNKMYGTVTGYSGAVRDNPSRCVTQRRVVGRCVRRRGGSGSSVAHSLAARHGVGTVVGFAVGERGHRCRHVRRFQHLVDHVHATGGVRDGRLSRRSASHEVDGSAHRRGVLPRYRSRSVGVGRGDTRHGGTLDVRHRLHHRRRNSSQRVRSRQRHVRPLSGAPRSQDRKPSPARRKGRWPISSTRCFARMPKQGGMTRRRSKRLRRSPK